MIGKKIGVQAGNLLSFKAFLKLVKIPVSAVHIVPVQFDPTPLAAGTITSRSSSCEFPPAQTMRIGPGVVRELHWDKEAEWAYTLKGMFA